MGCGWVLVGVLERVLPGGGVQYSSLGSDGEGGSESSGINLGLPLGGVVKTGYHF